MNPDNFFTRQQRESSGSAGDQQIFLKNLASAISQDELCLHYQPRYKCLTGKATVLEALTRWQRDDVGLLYPETFISAAETHGLIYKLDMWVFEQCCKDLVWLRAQMSDEIKIAVNISMRSCESVYFSQKLIELCVKHELSLNDFIIEITVGTHSHDIRKVKAFCATLSNFGATFCLDDFGTGQSPLLNLFELPVSSICIDRQLVQNIIQSERSETIVKHLVALANELGIKTIAEGVEHADEYKMLKDIGCDEIQGYFLSRPLSREKISASVLSL